MEKKTTFELFSDRLKDLMCENGLTIKQLSLETKIPRSTINGWTLLVSKPQIDALVTLADYFEVSVDYLLGRID